MEQSLELGFADVVKADKKQLQAISANMLSKATDGELDPVEAFSAARKGKEFFEKMEEGLRPLVEKELKLTKGQDYKHNSVLFEGAITKTSYDFTVCKDVVWDELSAQIKELTEKKKDREAYLKTIKSKKSEINDDTGEVYEIFPPVKSETEGIKVSLK